MNSSLGGCVQTRTCDNPPPANGGAPCDGSPIAQCPSSECPVTCNPPCQNGGSCSSGVCTCLPPFSGQDCTVTCNPPCQNGGSCSSGVCTCLPPFSGQNCTICTPQATVVPTFSPSTGITRATTVTLAATLTFTQCPEDPQSWTFAWFDGNNVQVSSTSTYVIPAYTLDPLTSYTYTVIATHGVAQATAQVSFDVGRSQPIGLVTPVSISVEPGSHLISASDSSDVDYPGDSSRLRYFWTCGSGDFTTCDNFLAAANNVDHTVFAAILDAQPDQLYAITVTVCTVDPPTNCAQAAPSNIITTSALIFQVESYCQSPVVGAGGTIRCQGVVEEVNAYSSEVNQPTLTYSWSSPDMDLLAVASSPLDTPYIAVSALKLARGRTYRLQLIITHTKDGVQVSTSRVFPVSITNTVPTTDSETPFSVTPAYGTAFETKFILHASGWQSPTPSSSGLSYQFTATLMDGSEIILSDLESAPYITTYLPVGATTVSVKVSSADGAMVATHLPVAVLLSPQHAKMPAECVALDVYSKQFLNSAYGADFHAALQLVVFLTRFVNENPAASVDCQTYLSAVPPSKDPINVQLFKAWNAVATQTQFSYGILTSSMSAFLAQSHAGLLEAVPDMAYNKATLATSEQELQTYVGVLPKSISSAVGAPVLDMAFELMRHASAVGDCERVLRTQDVVNNILAKLVVTSVPGEVGLQYSHRNTQALVQRVLTTRQSDLEIVVDSATGSRVRLSPAALRTANANSADVRVIRMANLERCAKGQVISDSVNVEIVAGENVVQIKDVDNAIQITLPAEKATSESACAWYNTRSKSWSTSGCSMELDATTNQAVCTCNHLTQFAIINPSSTSSYNSVAYIGVFGGLVLVILLHSLAISFAANYSLLPRFYLLVPSLFLLVSTINHLLLALHWEGIITFSSASRDAVACISLLIQAAALIVVFLQFRASNTLAKREGVYLTVVLLSALLLVEFVFVITELLLVEALSLGPSVILPLFAVSDILLIAGFVTASRFLLQGYKVKGEKLDGGASPPSDYMTLRESVDLESS